MTCEVVVAGVSSVEETVTVSLRSGSPSSSSEVVERGQRDAKQLKKSYKLFGTRSEKIWDDFSNSERSGGYRPRLLGQALDRLTMQETCKHLNCDTENGKNLLIKCFILLLLEPLKIL